MRIYNTLTKKKDEFKPLTDKTVKMYVCGPTVYDNAHLGNLRTYINTDILRRWLKYSGYKVDEVMNITDIEDKIIKKSQEEQVSYKLVTQKYEKAFKNDLMNLNIELPEKMPHATDKDVIEQIIKIISFLLEKGIAYKSEDGSVYFSVSKFDDYGKLSGVDLAGIKKGARVDQDEYEKENAQDFALWKAKQDDEPFWPAPFGDGRPGWHIECSAMSTKYLGDTLDIHAGGVDLIFPHHENEIAQSQAFTGKPFVNYWFHCEHLLIEGQKMSKSLKNIYTLDQMTQKYKVEPLALRMLVLSTNYHERLNFTHESIVASNITLKNLYNDILELLETKKGMKGIKVNNIDSLIQEATDKFEVAMNDDLSTPKALSYVFEFLNSINRESHKLYEKEDADKVYAFLLKVDQVLGLGLYQVKAIEVPENVMELVKEREKAREDKDWTMSDQLRLKIKSLGYEVEDTPEGSKVKKS